MKTAAILRDISRTRIARDQLLDQLLTDERRYVGMKGDIVDRVIEILVRGLARRQDFAVQ